MAQYVNVHTRPQCDDRSTRTYDANTAFSNLFLHSISRS
jgi:hypothetical protein